MKQKLSLILIVALLAGVTLAGAGPAVTRSYSNEPLIKVLLDLAKVLNLELKVDPQVGGTVTISFDALPAEEALKKVLGKKYSYKISRSRLYVGSPAYLARVPVVREEARKPQDDQPARDRMSITAHIAPSPKRSVNSPAPKFNTESYDHMEETGFKEVAGNPLSTFSIDVDTASYSNIRRFLQQGQHPPVDAVRIEEMLNYFTYDFPKPDDSKPFQVTTELSESPWSPERQLLQIGLAARELDMGKNPPKNLVFLLDVSGSMTSADKLPLLKNALKLLVKRLTPEDRVSIVVYAGASGVVLPPTSGSEQATILAALEKLSAGGSTNGGAGINLAYDLAAENFQPDAMNRVILATDGDFNVGTSSRGALVRLIEEKREKGVFLTVLGFGTGNLKDSTMEQLADKGNGNYAYIDNLMEAKKVLVEEVGGTLVTVAKDVKLQVEFNPEQVKSYRLIGYENRRLNSEDFDNDKKDAGEMGAGHTITALYEILPGRSEGGNLRYQGERTSREAAYSDELALVKVRYKEPDGEKSALSSFVVKATPRAFAEASENLRFAAGVAAAGMLLRDSEYRGSATYDSTLGWVRSALGEDRGGYRREFVKMVELARDLE